MRATEITTLLTQVLEKSDTVVLQKPIKGLNYTTRKPETIPTGTYTILGPDEEDPKYVVLGASDKKTLYLAKEVNVK